MAESINAVAQDINAVAKFELDLNNLVTVLGKSDVTVLPQGTNMNVYKTTGTLSTATVAAGAQIPLSEVQAELDEQKTLTFMKYRRITPIETIQTIGYDKAVAAADGEMLRQVAAKVRAAYFTAITATGITTGTAGASFQAAAANAWASLETKFEDEGVTPVFFAHPTAAAGYLASANVTIQDAFGLKYIENFMGMGTLVIDSNCPTACVLATAVENINVVAARLGDIPGMDMTSDASGIIAVHNGAKYENGGIESVIFCGLCVYASVLDRVVKCAISA